MPKPYYPCFTAKQVLDGVEQWVEGCILVRETGALWSGNRIDGLLVPVHWSAKIHQRAKVRLGLVGVEVKIRRGDFLRGLKSGQFDRYAEALSGLYIATTGPVCKTREIPRDFGHLVVNKSRGHGVVCICKRHPQWRDGQLSVGDMWKVLFQVVECIQEETVQEREKYANWKESTGLRIVSRVMTALSHIEKDQITRDRAGQDGQ